MQILAAGVSGNITVSKRISGNSIDSLEHRNTLTRFILYIRTYFAWTYEPGRKVENIKNFQH